MEKILFCLQTMNLGGVEKELITVLKKIHNDFDITLLLLYQEDKTILTEIPDNINIQIVNIDKEYYVGSLSNLTKKRIKKGKIVESLMIVAKRIFGKGMTGSNINLTDIPLYDDFFDTAICYHIHSPLLLKYVVEKVKARRKIAWIHNDFYSSGYPISRLKKLVVKYDEFVAVSSKVEKEFRALCPWYQGGISTVYNYMDAEEIITLSKEAITEEIYTQDNTVKLLTVGRFTEQKGIDYAIEAVALLKEKNIKFHWFLIGYGELEPLYHQLVEKFNVGDCFTILGKKTNPYPYIKNCDIYVQPSRHEAWGLVVTEAKILGKPIVCTDFDGADEQIDNGVNGIIVPVNDVDALAKELFRLIQSPEQRAMFSKELEGWSQENTLQEIVRHFVQ